MIDQQQLASLRAEWTRRGGYAQCRGCACGRNECSTWEALVAEEEQKVLGAMRSEIERLREELRKAVELLKEAAPRFVSYEECLDWQDQGEDCIAKDGHWEHELRTKMDEFVERNKESQ